MKLTLPRSVGKSISLMGILVALGVYLKEFYLFSSGSLQLGDMCLIMGFCLAMLKNRVKIVYIDLKLYVFIISAILINVLYMLLLGSSSFIQYSIFLLFSVIMVLLTRSFCNDKKILRLILFALKAALITQLGISFTSHGRYLFGRYTGTFNDPNQFGYFVLMSLLLIYVIHHMLGEKHRIYWIVIATYLIVLSQSSGMFLGLAVFLLILLWQYSTIQQSRIKWLLRLLFVFLIIFTALVVYMFSDYSITSFLTGGSISGLRRLTNRLSGSSDFSSMLDFYIKDRSITRIMINPWGLLYGTGEGMWERYPQGNEIHATMIALCYYYGVIPYTFWVLWIRDNLHHISPKLYCVYAAAIIEAFTLANHRQPFFWMIFVLASSNLCKRNGI